MRLSVCLSARLSINYYCSYSAIYDLSKHGRVLAFYGTFFGHSQSLSDDIVVDLSVDLQSGVVPSNDSAWCFTNTF